MTRWVLIHPKYGLLKRCTAEDLAAARQHFGWHPDAVTWVTSEASYSVDGGGVVAPPTPSADGSQPLTHLPKGALTMQEMAAELGMSYAGLQKALWRCAIRPIKAFGPNRRTMNFYTRRDLQTLRRAREKADRERAARVAAAARRLTPEERRARMLERLRVSRLAKYAARDAAKAEAARSAAGRTA